MSWLLIEGHLEHKLLKMTKCNEDWTLKFFNDLELCSCMVLDA